MRRLVAIIIGIVVGFLPGAAAADIGIPMIAPTLSLMVVSLVPVILIEAIVLATRLGIAFLQALRSASAANLLSMLIGVPLTWVLLVIAQFVTGADGDIMREASKWLRNLLSVTWSAPWLGGVGPIEDWMVPVAMLVLLVPYFFASWQIETLIVARIIKFDRREVSRACLIGNAITYALMAGIVILLWSFRSLGEKFLAAGEEIFSIFF